MTVQRKKVQVSVVDMAKLHIRWMIRRDMEEVLAMEQANYDPPWCEEDFLSALRQRNCIGMVAESPDDSSVGFSVFGAMIYELHTHSLVVSNFCVHPAHRHRGIGTAMVNKLKSKLSSMRRLSVAFVLRESNLSGLMFLKRQGFIATRFIRDRFEKTDGRDEEGGIRMKYWIQ